MAVKKKQPLFFSSNLKREEKENRLIQLMSAVREAGAKALGSSVNMTYEKAFGLLSLSEPDLFNDVGKFFNEQESAPILVPHFRQFSLLKKIEPELLIKTELDELETALENVLLRDKKKKFTALQKRVIQLKLALNYFKRERIRELEREKEEKEGEKEKIELEEPDKVKLREETALRRDFETAARSKYIYTKVEVTEDGFREFVLPNKRLMRIRYLHNLAPEELTGVDLVYEQINIETQKIRFIHLQYKMWNGHSFAVNTTREINQMKRMQKKLCDAGFCMSRKSGELPYRLPCCSAFYRPTHKKQSKNAQLITTGVHLPVCWVSSFQDPLTVHIDKEDVYTQGLSNTVFDELFRNGLIGSAWMDLKKAEKFYKENKIIESKNSLVINIRDETGHSKFELENKKILKDMI